MIADRNRRQFLRDGLLGLAACGLRPALADAASALRGARPIRVRGRVHSGGTGLARVPVSDGIDVVVTATDGTFELVTSSAADFVQLSVPSGYAIPRSPLGTAAHYAPIAASRGGEMAVEFALSRMPDSGDRHGFILLADVQTKVAEEMAWFHEQTIPDIVASRSDLGTEDAFGVACGDIMYDNLGLYGEYEHGVAAMDMPFFQVVGNHDLDRPSGTDKASTSTFCGRFGPRNYSFDRGAVHYVVLDDVMWHGAGYIGYLDDPTIGWLAADLALIEPGRTVVVATHIPLRSGLIERTAWATAEEHSLLNRELLYRLLEPYEAHVLSGHTHESEHRLEQGVQEHVHGTVCGAWWTGPICADGTPNGYAIYDVAGSELRWRYKATGLAATEQMTLYPRGADHAAPDEIVANVWNWDEHWDVAWHLDGEPMGPMARRRGYDPRAVELHTGPALPTRATWVEPYLTDHLFYAPLAPDAGAVTVEATDRFGNVFTASL